MYQNEIPKKRESEYTQSGSADLGSPVGEHLEPLVEGGNLWLEEDVPLFEQAEATLFTGGVVAGLPVSIIIFLVHFISVPILCNRSDFCPEYGNCFPTNVRLFVSKLVSQN